MQYGYFDDDAYEYVITTPFTPTKWINYVGTLAFGGFVDHTGGALICKGDPALNRITKYIPQLPASDFRGESLYLRLHTAQGFKVFSPFHTPCRSHLDHYECRVGLGYTRIISESLGIRTDVTIFVPPDSSCEIRWYTFTNVGSQPIRVDAVPVVEYSHFDALKQFTNADWVPQTMQSEAIYLDDNLILTQYAFMRKDTHINYFTANRFADSYDTDRRHFLGNNEYGSWADPGALYQPSLSNSIAWRGDNIGAILCPLDTLQPGDSCRMVTQLGQTENIFYSSAIQFFYDERNVMASFAQLKLFWKEYLDKMQVHTPDASFDSLINIHNARQCFTTFNWSRYLSLYQLALGSRGLGTRDSSQDILGVLHAVPCQAKALLRKLLTIQTPEGYAMHQVFPLSMLATMGDAEESPDRPQYYSDDHLWLVLAVVAYVKETGHLKFLDEALPFYNRELHRVSEESATVREHLSRAVEFSFKDRGKHGLCLLGFADWNDTINLRTGAESALTTCLLGMALRELAALAEFEGDKQQADRFISAYHELKDNFNEQAWDGKWYLSYFDADGTPLGSESCQYGKIYTYGQAMPVMAGFAEGIQARGALDAVNHLLTTEHGIKLSTPGFNGFDPSKGGITTYPPGAKENCGIFMHVNPWVIIAETLLGNSDQAYHYHAQTNPARKNDIVDVYECEPYVYAQNILSDEHPQFGLARNSWLSGTATWMFTAATQYILGVRPTFDGLLLEPCLPTDWEAIQITRHFRGAVYQISIQNPQKKPKGSLLIRVDGTEISGNKIPLFSSGKHEVEAIMQ